ncbi:class I SAM-dependent methyltransferase [Larkinella sp. VNQ87]|uniref:class I SAM-dependent methyltransferase n=1 Tax=Larkinella sp. VNQ87 TaxID=3400921 RepID=UPI003BFE9760
MDNPKEIVRRGYDQLGGAYRTFFENDTKNRYQPWLADLVGRLPPNSHVLELGCGDGIPTALFLSPLTNYRGIDLSPYQIELARQNIPATRFEVADMAGLDFPEASFDGVLALYSLIHLPLAEQPAVIQSVFNWLKPCGYFLCITGATDWTGLSHGWIRPDVTMFWSHTNAVSYQQWFIETGFTLIENYFVPEGNEGHTYFLLQKPA